MFNAAIRKTTFTLAVWYKIACKNCPR